MTTFIDLRNDRGVLQKKRPRRLSYVNIKPYDVMTS